MHKTPEITKLIQQNLWIVLSYALARPVAEKVLKEHFDGEWNYLDQMIHDHAEIRADRALLEMATQLRVLDDAEGINEYLKQTKHPPFGVVGQANGEKTDLHFRDMTNKIMHAAEFSWQCGEAPAVICVSNDPGRWDYAEVGLISLMSLCGGLIS